MMESGLVNVVLYRKTHMGIDGDYFQLEVIRQGSSYFARYCRRAYGGRWKVKPLRTGEVLVRFWDGEGWREGDLLLDEQEVDEYLAYGRFLFVLSGGEVWFMRSGALERWSEELSGKLAARLDEEGFVSGS